MHRALRTAAVYGLTGLCLGALLSRAGAQQVLIELNDSTSETDDYLCWSPVHGRARLAGLAASPVTVKLSGDSTANAGAVWFQEDSGTTPAPAAFSPTEELDLTLPGNGDWVGFWTAGKRASNGSKDVRIVATVAGTEEGNLPVMVRVRKDAETLSPIEITQFLESVRQVHDLDNGAIASKLARYSQAHAEAFGLGIHGTPLFLAWHRAFLLAFERDLQTVDPRVSLPYWRFDKPNTTIFTADFMGTVAGGPSTPGGFLVRFASSNPLFGWRMSTGGGLVRRADATGVGIANPAQLGILLALDNYSEVNQSAERNYHNGAHNAGGGWLGTGSSPRDPTFFLLHANVDRAWAHWQARHDKFDPDGTDQDSYSALGSYPGPGASFRQGVYAMDEMWPWNERGGNQGTPDLGDDWPLVAFAMAGAPAGGVGPVLPPTVIGQVDYLDVNGRSLAHGACYDDIDYRGQTPEGGPT